MLACCVPACSSDGGADGGGGTGGAAGSGGAGGGAGNGGGVGGNDRAADNNGPVIDFAGTVGPEGGSVDAHNGRVSVDFPAGAVLEDTNIRVSPLANVGVPGLVAPTVFDFGPDGAVFDSPVTLTLRYNQSEVPEGFDETQFIMLGSTHDTGELVPIPGSTVDPDANTITAPISGFSTFGMAISGCTVEGEPLLPWCPPRCGLVPPTYPDDPGGELDASFGTDGTLTFEIGGTAGNTSVGKDLIIDDEGRFLIAADLVRASVIRVLPDGQGLDSSFGDQGIARYTDTVNSLVMSMALRTDGRILLYALRQPAGGGLPLLLVRFLRNGALDPDFGDNGVVLDQRMDRLSGSGAVASLPDGRALVFDAFGIYRFLEDGSEDPSFGAEGIVIPEDFGTINEVLRRATGDWIGTWAPNLQVVNEDGSTGPVYRGTLAGSFAGGFAELPGGLYATAGTRRTGSGLDVTRTMYAARFRPGDAPGSLELDPCFGRAGSRTYTFGENVVGADAAVQTDGRIVIVGTDTEGRDDADIVVVRIRPDGEIDRGFGTDGIVYLDFGADESGTSVAIDDQGRIVVVGSSLVGDPLFGERTAVMARLLP
jgi:uncharacterized delta-60 repeat protein